MKKKRRPPRTQIHLNKEKPPQTPCKEQTALSPIYTIHSEGHLETMEDRFIVYNFLGDLRSQLDLNAVETIWIETLSK